MSVLIKGMKMPKNCCECRLLSGMECRALLKDITDFSVADECPLVPVQPHGRLIDADELKDRVGYIEEEYGHIMEEINNAPTVDAVQVVRCKDCRFHEQEEPGIVYCPATVGGWVEENWFCKGGERKSE